MFAGKKVSMYNDDKEKATFLKEVMVKKNGELEVEIQSGGGFVLK